MRILIRNAYIINPASLHHATSKDVLIEDGIITKIDASIDVLEVDELVEGEGIYVSAGWVDLFATIGDPGLEHRETITSGLDAASNGGFTKVVISPDVLPTADSKSGIEYLLKLAAGHIVDALPLGAITKKLHGKELAEMYDMVNSGAVGVSNAKHTVADAKVMQVAMQYGNGLNVPFYSFTEDERLAHGGQMHEGVVSTMLGLKGIPALAEELAVTRDLYLARYTESPIHFSHITTAGAVALIREAKAQGMRVTASVPAHHLALLDESIQDFDSNYKVQPPLRDVTHVNALWEGLKDGTLDAIISDHEPLESEVKTMEFGQAKSGITALETLFPVLLKASAGRIPLEVFIAKLTTGPRQVLGLKQPVIAENEPAELTLFAPEMVWNYNETTASSLSSNTPFWNTEMVGQAFAVINHGAIAFSKA